MCVCMYVYIHLNILTYKHTCVFVFYRHHLEQGYPQHISGESKEIHPRHEDDICWFEKEERQSRFDCLLGASLQMMRQQLIYVKLGFFSISSFPSYLRV